MNPGHTQLRTAALIRRHSQLTSHVGNYLIKGEVGNYLIIDEEAAVNVESSNELIFPLSRWREVYNKNIDSLRMLNLYT